MYNKSQQFAADGRRTPLTWRRCAQRYANERVGSDIAIIPTAHFY